VSDRKTDGIRFPSHQQRTSPARSAHAKIQPGLPPAARNNVRNDADDSFGRMRVFRIRRNVPVIALQQRR
jgi:hypothetical protein